MTPKDVLDYYTSRYNFSKMTGMSAQSLTNWITKGWIPLATQSRLQLLTGGALKADLTKIEIMTPDLLQELEDLRAFKRTVLSDNKTDEKGKND